MGRKIKIRANTSPISQGNKGDEKFLINFKKGGGAFVRANNSASARNKIKTEYPSAEVTSRKFNGTVFAFNVNRKKKKR